MSLTIPADAALEAEMEDVMNEADAAPLQRQTQGSLENPGSSKRTAEEVS